jgi:hypothetical protein
MAGCTNPNIFSYVPVCSQIMSSSKYSTDPWAPMKNKVDYCLAESANERCKLEFNPRLAWVVVTFNLAKTCILCYAFFFIKENPLMNMGDAVASFLTRRDETTENLCLMEKNNVGMWEKPRWANAGMPEKPLPMTFCKTKSQWRSVVSRRRWLTCLGL